MRPLLLNLELSNCRIPLLLAAQCPEQLRLLSSTLALLKIIHLEMRSKTHHRATVNIGGIANIALLGKTVLGFDTGPGNGLLDAWIKKHKNKEYDQNGEWAATGKVDHPRKSTG